MADRGGRVNCVHTPIEPPSGLLRRGGIHKWDASWNGGPGSVVAAPPTKHCSNGLVEVGE